MNAYDLRYLTRRGYQSWLRRRGGGPEPLLILGHMRTGGTLLNHLLVENPEITGMGERFLHYQSPEQLARLAAVVYASRPTLRTSHRYVVDQVNHRSFAPVPELLTGVRQIVLVREPGPTTASIERLFGEFWFWEPGVADHYYVTRLGELEQHLALAEPGRVATVTYAQLTGDTEPTLARLTRFLGLREPLTSSYSEQPFSGRRGDPSANIREGSIRAASASAGAGRTASPEAEEAYRRLTTSPAFLAAAEG